ncbi:MAG: WS/DGAT/MGAT family O-acyltransferase [Dehalococcoidia bacterium]
MALNRRMTSMDASFLYFEGPQTPLHIGSTSPLDGHLSREELITHMAGRMERIPRYRQRAGFDTFNVGHPVWEDDPEFDLGRHIEERRLPEGAGEAELLATIADIFAGMLPRDRPLWKMVLIQGLPEGRTAVASLVHHCMVDGVSGIELLAAITDLQREAPQTEPAPFRPAAAPDPMERARDAWFDTLRQMTTAASDAMRRTFDPQVQIREMQTISRALSSAAPMMMQPAPATPFNRPVGGGRSYSMLPMPFAEIRGVRSVVGGTINDVVLSTLAGGLGAYLRGLGVATDGMELRVMVPVNVRSDADKDALGNQVSMFLVPLPVGILDPVERHQALMAKMGGLKEANQAGGFAILSKLSEQVPPVLQAMAGMWTPQVQPLFNLVCTNVPGPQVPLYLAGRRLEGLWPLVPLAMGLGLGVAQTSYNGVLYWGVATDPALVADAGTVVREIGAAFEGLKAAALAMAARA